MACYLVIVSSPPTRTQKSSLKSRERGPGEQRTRHLSVTFQEPEHEREKENLVEHEVGGRLPVCTRLLPAKDLALIFHD